MNKLPNYEQSVIDAFASQGTENGSLGGSEECKIGTAEWNKSVRTIFFVPIWYLVICSLIKFVQTLIFSFSLSGKVLMRKATFYYWVMRRKILLLLSFLFAFCFKFK